MPAKSILVCPPERFLTGGWTRQSPEMANRSVCYSLLPFDARDIVSSTEMLGCLKIGRMARLNDEPARRARLPFTGCSSRKEQSSAAANEWRRFAPAPSRAGRLHTRDDQILAYAGKRLLLTKA